MIWFAFVCYMSSSVCNDRVIVSHYCCSCMYVRSYTCTVPPTLAITHISHSHTGLHYLHHSCCSCMYVCSYTCTVPPTLAITHISHSHTGLHYLLLSTHNAASTRPHLCLLSVCFLQWRGGGASHTVCRTVPHPLSAHDIQRGVLVKLGQVHFAVKECHDMLANVTACVNNWGVIWNDKGDTVTRWWHCGWHSLDNEEPSLGIQHWGHSTTYFFHHLVYRTTFKYISEMSDIWVLTWLVILTNSEKHCACLTKYM